MKKLVCGVLCLILCLSNVSALAEDAFPDAEGEEVYGEDQMIGEEDEAEESDGSALEATQNTVDINPLDMIEWSFPVSLTALSSEYAMLVNADNLLDSDFEPDPLVKVTGVKRATSSAVYLQETAARALSEMFEGAMQVTEYTYTLESGKTKTAKYSNGMVLYLKSGYRSYGQQATVYTNYLARNNNVDDGYVAKPGGSEHQSGLCADILNADYASRPTMTQDFKWTAEAQWMKENCAQYGFILRFLEGKESITGIQFEPWHFRYVGKEIAEYIMDNDITLEEFTEAANEAIADFKARGGDLELQKAYEDQYLNAPPQTFVLDEYGTDGDAEISMIF